ncbi:MAG: hypothetical protein ACPGVU_21515, partial [Limisphaerales bacterium]
MHRTRFAALTLCFFGVLRAVNAQTSAFTFQGHLADKGIPANGPYDLRFTLYTAALEGMPASGAFFAEDVDVHNGI